MNIRVVFFLALVLVGISCAAQDEPVHVVLRAWQGSSGPFGGQKGKSCFMLYADGRIVECSSSSSALGVRDERGHVTHSEKSESREYRFPERDSWQIENFLDFLQSKPLRLLDSYFPPPHKPIDYIETSTVEVLLPKGKIKQISTREYYVASLVEKARYPSALIILMDKIEELEHIVSERGKPLGVPLECEFDETRKR